MNKSSNNKVFIDGIIFSLQTNGGISVFWGEIIKRMVRDRCDFLLLDAGNSAHNNIRKCLEIPAQNIVSETNLHTVFRRLLSINAPPGYLFTSTYYRSSGKSHCCQLSVVYDLTHEHHISGLRSAMHSWLKKRAVKQSKHTVTISQSTKKDILHTFQFVNANAVSVIYPGCNDKFFQYQDKSSLSLLGPDKLAHDPFALFVGSRKPYKKFNIAVEAVSQVQGYKLIVVGGGSFSLKEREFLEEQLGGRYGHYENPSDEGLNELYNHAKALLYPSSYEGFGIPIVEAMAAGCPVIASNTSSIPEAGGNAAMLLDNISAHSLAKGIETLKTSGVRSELIERGLNHARKFTWESSYSQMMEVFDLLLGQSYDAVRR